MANAENVKAEFGDRVQFNNDGSVVVNYGTGEHWLNLTFAVPSADSFEFSQSMIGAGKDQKKQENKNEEDEDEEDDDDEDEDEDSQCWMGTETTIFADWRANSLVFEYNKLGADCQIFLGRTEYTSHLQMPSSNIDEDIEILKDQVVRVGIGGTNLEYFNTAKQEDKPNQKPIKLECAVKNEPIDVVVPGLNQPFFFHINFLPSSLTEFGPPKCKNRLKIIFNSPYELVMPKKTKN